MDKSWVVTIDDKIQEDTVTYGLSYFFPLFFSPSPCEITHSVKRSARYDVI